MSSTTQAGEALAPVVDEISRKNGSAPASIRWEWHFEIAASPERVWPLLMDTSRFNRALGLTPFQYTEVDGRRLGLWRWYGATHAWEEPPWTWSSAVFGECVRIYRRGPGTLLRVRYDLAPSGDGCRVTIRLDWSPRGFLGRLALRLAQPDFARRYARAIHLLAASLEAGALQPALLLPAPRLSADAAWRLDVAKGKLEEAGISQRAAQALVAHVRDADDLDLARIRPRALARRLGLEGREALLACLHATRAGLLDITWDLVCPHCRDVRRSVRSLGEVPREARCDVCRVSFTTQPAEALEVTFRVHPAVRVVPQVTYCLAETATRGEILIQYPLPPGGRAEISTRLGEGAYRMRAVGLDEVCSLRVTHDAEPRSARWRPLETGSLEVGTSPLLEIENPGSSDVIFALERAARDPDALRPADLFHVQELRDLLGAEQLAADVSLSVGEVTVLFTDIVGSTGLYAELGDVGAFAAVKRHFQEIYSVVGVHGGAVIKTIGDAAMATFHRPIDALRAAVALQRHFSGDGGGTPVRLRISLNVGPCIAVNLNNGIDYFGHTVNIAAKMQAVSGPGQIVLPEALMTDAEVAGLAEEAGARFVRAILEPPRGKEAVPICRWSMH